MSRLLARDCRVLLASAAALTSVGGPETERLPLEDADAAAARLAESEEHVLLVGRAEDRATVVRALATAPTGLVGFVATHTGHLATAVHAATVACAHRESGLDAALVVAHRLELHQASQVLLRSLNHVDTPAPSMSQAVRSLLPNARFAVCTGAVAEVQAPPRAPALEGGRPVAAALAAGAPEWMTEAVGQLVGPSLRPVAAPPGPTQYRVQQWAEVVWWQQQQVDALLDAARDARLPSCAWCRAPQLHGSCDFCGHSGEPTAGGAGT